MDTNINNTDEKLVLTLPVASIGKDSVRLGWHPNHVLEVTMVEHKMGSDGVIFTMQPAFPRIFKTAKEGDMFTVEVTHGNK